MILRILIYGFLAYLAVRFIFGFLIPVVRTTRQVRRQFEEARNRMQDQMQDSYPTAAPRQQSASPTRSQGDYIEFEEVRD
jgi:hypothetical protein